MSPGWDLTEPGPGIVGVRFSGEGDGCVERELTLALADRERRVLLVEDLKSWPRQTEGSGALLAGERAPVVVAVSGPVPDCALADLLAADVRLGGSSMVASFSASDGGVLTDPATLSRLVSLVGAGTAGYWVLSRCRVESAAALAKGLIDDVVEERSLAASALDTAMRIAAGAPLALEYAKEAIRRGERQRLEDAFQLEGDLYSILQATDDRSEGVSAFLDRREPRFSGR